MTADLDRLDEVEEATASSERIFFAAALLVVKVAGPVLEGAATAVPVRQKIVELVRGRGVSGATIELANGTKISVDKVSVEDLERLIEAAKKS